MSAPAPSCRGCPRWGTGCHDAASCPPWAAYQEALEADRRRRKEEAAKVGLLSDYAKAIRHRIEARRGSHERRRP